ncbi:DUF4389 domain-containing protein [Candidatus Gottesmanbacteria bacterium]|nr:DUF4389 domain-containing protein [Candidatus Gottesmanbacteria bacterium]
MASSAEKIPSDLYPTLKITRIKNPNKFYAIPLLGFLVKIIILLPVYIVFAIYGVALFLILAINSFYILFTGKFWKSAYDFELGFMRYTAKLYFFFFGLTDTYPGFDFTIHDSYTLDIHYPKNPSRFFAIPILGGIVRMILLVPYFIFEQVVSTGGFIGVVVSFYRVLTKGEYPESTFELARDSVRIREAAGAYMMGLSDSYPSFWISFNHKNIKIALIIAGIVVSFGNWTNQDFFHNQYEYDSKYRDEKPFYVPNLEGRDRGIRAL